MYQRNYITERSGAALTTLQEAEIAAARAGLGADGSGEASIVVPQCDCFTRKRPVLYYEVGFPARKLDPPFSFRERGSDIG